MKKAFIAAIFLLAALYLPAQVQYEISQDPKHPEVKVLRGTLTKDIIKNDTSFKWYAESQSYYKPEAAVLNIFKDSANKFQFIIFGGTWCEDTEFILPKFYKLQEQSNLSENNITLYGVDRDKHTLGHIAEAFAITNVPTIIVMKAGKEIGRIVEYGKTGKWDAELTELLKH